MPASNSSREDSVERNVIVSKLFFGRFCRFEASGCSVLTSVQWFVSRGEMFVTVDGALGRHLEMGDEVQIRQAPHRTVLLKNPDLDPFAILRQKLRWGAR